MIVRITTPGPQENWFHGVIAARSEHGYLKLTLAEHPHHVAFWRGDPPHVKVLVCASEADVVDALREERAVRATAMDEVRR